MPSGKPDASKPSSGTVEGIFVVPSQTIPINNYTHQVSEIIESFTAFIATSIDLILMCYLTWLGGKKHI